MQYICHSKYLIYLLSSKTRGKQYIGHTTNNFRIRWNKHKSDARKVENGNMENVKQTFLQSLFLQSNHQALLKDENIKLTDKTQTSHPTKWEFHWMRILRTLYPDGLNIGSDYWLSF